MKRFLTALILVQILLSALVPSPAQAQGETNFSLRFYGHGTGNIDRLRIPIDPPTAADIGGDFTLEFWLRALPEENSGSATCNVKDGWITGNIIFDRDIWGDGDYGDWGISLSNGRIAFGITKGANGTTLCGRTNVADGVWHHVAVTRRASDGLMRIFVDGWLDGQKYGPKGDISYRNGRSTAFPNDPYLVIGAEKHDAGPSFPSFSGWLDEIRLSTVVRYTGAFTPSFRPFQPDSRTAFLYHFDEASGEGACNPTIPDASGNINAECLFGGNAPAGPQYSAANPFAPQRIAIPSYFEPGELWNQLIAGAPTVGLAIINPADGPGSSVDPAYQTTVTQSQRNGILTLGYVATNYGRRSLTAVQQEIRRYFSWYAVNGIFLDEASTSCAKLSYYAALYRYIKQQRSGAKVVLNPGMNTSECYMKVADIIVNFEDPFSAYQNWMPSPWVYQYPPQRFWHLVIGASQSEMQQAIHLSKGRHAGWVYVTPDDLPNPWDSLPSDPYWTDELNAVQSPFWANDFRKGVSFATWWQGNYVTQTADQVLTQLLPADGVEWISLIVTCYQPTLTSTTIDCTLPRTPTDSDLIHVIQTAHAHGLKVMLKPHVDLGDNSAWRGQIQFGNDETKWQEWFTNYTAFITHYATLARDYHVELFAVGTELVGTTHRETDWRNVITAVRNIYSGPLTYAANHSGEETSITWWDALDFIGVDAYYPLTNKNNPAPEELRNAFNPVLTTLSSLSSTWNKPILLTEIGYRSIDGANRAPWDWQRDAPLDLQEQKFCYMAALSAFAPQPWLKGIFWWAWQPDEPLHNIYDKGYGVYRKPAEQVLRAFYLLP